jgi:hypothetical protein
LRACTNLVLLAALSTIAWAPAADAAKRTVCTITVNSPNEKETFRRYLPHDEYDFVELVERGRPDWLASACRQGVRCDVLVISGHFNGNEFFSDRLDLSEYLPVAELERASCNSTCSGLFSQLKEVHLFGCDSLNAEASKDPPAEIVRSLLRSGHSRTDAERIARDLTVRHVESNRDVMRRIFKKVPAIYGFSSAAPVGALSASYLTRYFQSGGRAEVGTGRPNSRLPNYFTTNSMTIARGLNDGDPRFAHRAEVCEFVDERLSRAQALGVIHKTLRREMAEARMHFERIESFMASLDENARQSPAVANALDEIERDRDARTRYLAFARDADHPSIHARMIDVARNLGWLSPAEYAAERNDLVAGLLAKSAMSPADVDLICRLNDDHALDAVLERAPPSPVAARRIDQAAALACLGSADDHARMLAALASPVLQDVQLAEVYFQHHPITDVQELRVVAKGIARMSGSEAQVRALQTLARHYVTDGESLAELTRLYELAQSVMVQRAIAGILIRSDRHALASADLVRVLRERRLKSPDAADIIDILLRRLQAS